MLLHYAASHSVSHCLTTLLTCKDIRVNIEDNNGKTKLHNAIKNSDIEGAQMLLAQEDINVNRQDKTGKSRLHYFATHLRSESI